MQRGGIRKLLDPNRSPAANGNLVALKGTKQGVVSIGDGEARRSGGAEWEARTGIHGRRGNKIIGGIGTGSYAHPVRGDKSIVSRVVKNFRHHAHRVGVQANQTIRRVIAETVRGEVTGGDSGQLGGDRAAGRVVSVAGFLNDVIVDVRERRIIRVIEDVTITADAGVVGVVIARVGGSGGGKGKHAGIAGIEAGHFAVFNLVGQVAGGNIVG